MEFRGAGLTLVADVAGDDRAAPVILLHGAGQTRSSWGKALEEIAGAGFFGLSFDLRGHGESDWSESVDYTYETTSEDLRLVVEQLGRPAFLVGASRGGRVALTYAGQGHSILGLVLVDVAPRIELAGTKRVGDFMRAWPNGFASLDEAADAVANYMPHRPRPKDPSGLMKNLRPSADGRLHWHWDPRMVESVFDPRQVEKHNDELALSAAKITAPVLLVRGLLSDMVSQQSVDELRALVPHAELVDVRDADHMVAGDRNDAFNAAVLAFLRHHTSG